MDSKNKSKMEFRMVEMQLMNIVNIGFYHNVPTKNIMTLGTAMIEATQLFLTDDEIGELKIQLKNRLGLDVIKHQQVY